MKTFSKIKTFIISNKIGLAILAGVFLLILLTLLPNENYRIADLETLSFNPSIKTMFEK